MELICPDIKTTMEINVLTFLCYTCILMYFDILLLCVFTLLYKIKK